LPVGALSAPKAFLHQLLEFLVLADPVSFELAVSFKDYAKRSQMAIGSLPQASRRSHRAPIRWISAQSFRSSRRSVPP
jgi:hypothetical protein